MVVKNPTANDIRVQILGVQYDLPANGELHNVPPEAAAIWKVKLHTFIQLSDEAPKKAPDEVVVKEDKPKTEKAEKSKATSTTKKK